MRPVTRGSRHRRKRGYDEIGRILDADDFLRAYIEELLPDGRIEPGRVFDRVTNIEGVPDGHRAMNEREVIEVMITLVPP